MPLEGVAFSKPETTILAKNKKRKGISVPHGKLITLKDEHGNFLRLLTRDELDFMRELGHPMKQMTLTIWQENPQVRPSNSPTSPIHLTGGCRNGRNAGDGGDIHALAGMHFSESQTSTRQKERLIGHGVLRERQPVLRVAKVETRVIVMSDEELAEGWDEYQAQHAPAA